MSLRAHKAAPRRATVGSRTRVTTRRPTGAATAPVRVLVDGAPGRPPTTDEVATLVNSGALTLDAGNALLAEITQRPLRGNRQATYRVPVAVPVAADSRPAAAMAQLDDTISTALQRMVWTSAAADPEGYAIDPPSQTSGGLGHAEVHADLRLTVTVPAYGAWRFLRVAADLLRQDLQQLCQLGLQIGTARRCPKDDENSDAWPSDDCRDPRRHDLRITPDDMLDDTGWFE